MYVVLCGENIIMIANELRIGNWVACEGKTYKVNINILQSFTVSPVWMDAIPLTPEILERCGFEKVGFTQWSNDLFTLTDVDEDGYLFSKSKSIEVIATIKYLHQLQNLYFSLTETELKVELLQPA